MDHGESRKGKCDRMSKLTEQDKEVYQEIISSTLFIGIWASLHRLRSMLREFALIALSRGNDGKCS